MNQDLIIDIDTPLGFKVRCSKKYWDETILLKHPILKDRINNVRKALSNPVSIRKSKKDDTVLLFYAEENPRWICAVIKDKKEYGFLITAYPTDSIKEGEEIWKK